MPHFRSPEELESKYVHEVYNDIAPGFRNTSYKAWPFVEQFLKTQTVGSLIADVGCGSGKYLGLTTNSFVMGSDSCEKLIEIAHERKHEVAVCNNLKLPYKDACFDAVISIGVIHHLASTKRRVKALQELGRILRPGGKMLVYVWAMEQNQRKFDAQDVLVPYTGNKGKGKGRKPIHQHSQDSPFKSSHKQSENNGVSLKRRSRSCDSLFDNYYSSDITDEDNNRQRSKDDIVPSPVEFGALKEVIETLKNKKDHLITNINSKVMKLYPEKEKQFVNDLVSTVVGKIFDRNTDTNADKGVKNESPTQKGLPNITEFVSALVKRLFKDKNGENQEEVAVDVEPFQDTTKCDDLSKENEDELKQSLYESLSAWAREKMALLSHERRTLIDIPREDSCDSEYSEVDLESASSYLLTDIHLNQDIQSSKHATDNMTTSKNVEHHISSQLSSDTDSDSSSSLDFLNSDSGISDSEASNSANSKKICPSTSTKTTSIKRTALQRYYHVFSAKELPDLIEENVLGVNVLKEYYDHGNWAVIAEKQ